MFTGNSGRKNINQTVPNSLEIRRPVPGGQVQTVRLSQSNSEEQIQVPAENDPRRVLLREGD